MKQTLSFLKFLQDLSCRPLSKIHNTKINAFLLLIFFGLGCDQNQQQIIEQETSLDEVKIREVHKDYVEGWRNMSEAKVMGLLEENSRIQPNTLKPIEGKENIREFWFPKDGSQTVINKYDTEIISLNVMDSIAITTHNSVLDWHYVKDTVQFGMLQKGLNTTIYRKQNDQSWKIWRSMWTDIFIKRK